VWYRYLIRGENFPGPLARSAAVVDGASPVAARERAGFFVTRFVEADTVERAEQNALLLLRSDPKLVPPEGYTPTGDARVFFEEISEVAPEDVPDPQPGLSFYRMAAQ
jgi:hypothetical protein